MRYRIICILIAVAVMDCGLNASEPPREQTGANLPMLASWLTGSFNSAKQAAEDTTYLDIRLTMTPVWQFFSSGFWFYVEQAVAGHEAKPYRQRVYFLTQVDDSTFRSDVYTLPDPARFIGAGNKENPLAEITPDSLDLREGCSIILRFDGRAFAGGTIGKDCGSDLRGAAYATSEVRLDEKQLISWDRGFDSTGVRVWGAEKGGYIFDKIK